MKRILFGITLLILLSGLWTGYSLSSPQQTAPRGQRTDPTLLSSRINKAKEKGVTELIVPAPVPYLAEVSGLEEALANYAVFIGMPIDSTSIIVDPRNIMTYHRFKILEMLSARARPNVGVPEELPTTLVPPKSDEIYVLEGGGTVVVDGVTVTQRGDYEYKKGEKYLLFVSRNLAQSTAMVNLGQYGVFIVKGDSVEGIVREPTPLKRDISERFANKIDNLIAALKKRKQ